MRTLATLVVTGLFLVLPGIAGAGTLHTPMLWSGGSPNLHDCQVLNVGNETLAVTVGIINYQGTPEFETTFGIGPGSGGGVVWSGSAQAYCRISFDGNKNSIRGSLCVRPPAADATCQAAVEAR